MTTETTLHQLQRMRWLLWGLTVVAVVVAWFAGPLIWAVAVVCLALAVWNEWVIRQGHRLRSR
jgi:Flp pilus assembly protein TadB